MNAEHTVPYYDSDLFHAVQLPYKSSDFSLTIVLPKTSESIDDLILQFFSLHSPENRELPTRFRAKKLKIHNAVTRGAR